jgi:phage recombination protein Bet
MSAELSVTNAQTAPGLLTNDQKSAGLLPPQWRREQIDLIKATVAVGASDEELQIFLYTARRSGLDPLLRQIYWIKRGGKGTIQVGIDGLRSMAARTGSYAGCADALFVGWEGEAEEYPAAATVTVYRLVQGNRCAFTATARWAEYYPGDDASGAMWRRMPHGQLGKCAEALALRKAFPAEMYGIYAQEELERSPMDPGRRPTGTVPASRSRSAPAPVNEGDQCPECHAPKGKPHGRRCSLALAPANSEQENLTPSPASGGADTSAV